MTKIVGKGGVGGSLVDKEGRGNLQISVKMGKKLSWSIYMYTILSKLLVCQLKPLDITFPGHSADRFSPVLSWKYIWDCYGKQRKVEFGLHSLPGSLFLGIWPD